MTLRLRRNTLLRLGSSTGETTVGVDVWVWPPLMVRKVMTKMRQKGLRL